MDLNQYILALKARRKAFVTVLAVTVFTAIVVALVIPKRYDATATILIDARDEQTMAPARMSPRERAGYIFTQMELIASGKVAHKVVRDLKLASYQKEKGVIGGDERMDVEYTRVAELSAELGRQKAATMDAQTRYKQAQDLIKDGVSLEAFPEVLANGYIITVKSALQAAEGRLQEQSEVLGPNHPTYQRTAAEVQGLKERLNAEATKVVTGLGNAVQQSAKRVEELQTSLKDQQDRIMKLREQRV